MIESSASDALDRHSISLSAPRHRCELHGHPVSVNEARTGTHIRSIAGSGCTALVHASCSRVSSDGPPRPTASSASFATSSLTQSPSSSSVRQAACHSATGFWSGRASTQSSDSARSVPRPSARPIARSISSDMHAVRTAELVAMRALRPKMSASPASALCSSTKTCRKSTEASSVHRDAANAAVRAHSTPGVDPSRGGLTRRCLTFGNSRLARTMLESHICWHPECLHRPPPGPGPQPTSKVAVVITSRSGAHQYSRRLSIRNPAAAETPLS